jgi:flagellar biosynthesis protein
MSAPDPRQTAVALAYDGGEAAPRIAAKGRGLVAEAIIARAREAGIYVHESPQLVALLMQVDLDAHIPENLYTAVAELLAWLHKLEKGSGAGAAAPPQQQVKQA